MIKMDDPLSEFEKSVIMKMNHVLFSGELCKHAKRKRIIANAEIKFSAAIYFLSPDVLKRLGAKLIAIGFGEYEKSSVVGVLNSMDEVPNCSNFVMVYDHHQIPIWDEQGNRILEHGKIPFLLYCYNEESPSARIC